MQIKKELKKKFNLIAEKILAEGGEEEKTVNKIIHSAAAFNSVFACFPIPIADVFVLTGVEIAMMRVIAKKMGVKFKLWRFFAEVGGVIGLGFGAQQTAIMLYKYIIPVGGIPITMALVYGLTYAVGNVCKYYCKCIQEGIKPDREKMKEIFKRTKSEKKEEAEKNPEIIEEAKKEFAGKPDCII